MQVLKSSIQPSRQPYPPLNNKTKPPKYQYSSLIRPIVQSITQPTYLPTHQPTNQPTNQPTDQPTNPPNHQPTHRSTSFATDTQENADTCPVETMSIQSPSRRGSVCSAKRHGSKTPSKQAVQYFPQQNIRNNPPPSPQQICNQNT